MIKTKLEKELKYSKSAFVDAAKDSKERLLLMTLLKDGTSYTKEQVEKVIKEWKAKSIKKKEAKS